MARGGATLFLYWLGILAFAHSQFFQKIQPGSTAEALFFFWFDTYQRRILLTGVLGSWNGLYMHFCQDIFVCCFFFSKKRGICHESGGSGKFYGTSFEDCFGILTVFFKKIIFSNNLGCHVLSEAFNPLTMPISGIMYSWWTNKTSRKHLHWYFNVGNLATTVEYFWWALRISTGSN